MYSVNFMRQTLDSEFFILDDHKQRFIDNPTKTRPSGWLVLDVAETDRVEEVFCATVPEYGKFALEDTS